MWKILKHMRAKEWLQITISLLFIVIQVGLDLKVPGHMSEITRLVQTPGSAIGEIWKQGSSMLLCVLGSAASALVIGFFAARVAAAFSQKLRSMLFSKVDSFSMEEINRFSTASLITRSTNDVTQIQILITMGLQLIIRAPIMAVWAVTKIAGKGYEWSLATGVAVLILMVAFTLIMIFVVPKFRKMQTLTDDLNKVTRENLAGLRVVRAYNAEAYQEEKFEKVNAELTATHLYTSRGMAVIMPLMNMLMGGLSLAVYWIGAYLINAAQIMERLTIFSNMVVFSSYAIQVIMSFVMLAMTFVLFPRASVSAKRINEVLDTTPSLVNGKKSAGKPGVAGKVEFKNVSFKYPGAAEYVLQNISFTVEQGETIAFIGSTGSGKSTLLNLVPRFFDTTSGDIFINGVNVKEYASEALYNKIGYVPQKAVLFRGTVCSNIAYGENGAAAATANEIKKALSIAQATDFVEAMNGKYEAEISRGGTNISGGQKQRLAIARAVCRKPEIYIFDDSFSALDYKTDRLLRRALKKETAGITSMIVAQRIGTIMDADQIIVLDEGQMVGKGTHQELLASCQIYQEIARSQFSEEELTA
jgi:ATP-binding cassette subfamily B multidrug efflux pump